MDRGNEKDYPPFAPLNDPNIIMMDEKITTTTTHFTTPKLIFNVLKIVLKIKVNMTFNVFISIWF